MDINHLQVYDDRTGWEWRSARIQHLINRRIVVSQNLKEFYINVLSKGDGILGNESSRIDGVLSSLEQEKIIVRYPPFNIENWIENDGKDWGSWIQGSGSKPVWVHDVFSVLFIGRFDNQKNPLFWLKVASAVWNTLSKEKDIPKTEFIMIGDGPLGGIVQHKLERSPSLQHIRNLTTLTGYIAKEDIPNFLVKNRATVLLMTSSFEGVPIVALEALGLGVPVVSMACGGIEEIALNSSLWGKSQSKIVFQNKTNEWKSISVQRHLLTSILSINCVEATKELEENPAFETILTNLLKQEVLEKYKNLTSKELEVSVKERWLKAQSFRELYNSTTFKNLWKKDIAEWMME